MRVAAAALVLDPESVTGVNGASGATDVVDVLVGDTLNGTQVTGGQVGLTVTSPATPLRAGAPVPVLGSDGKVDVPAGTPAGTYTIGYEVCETLNPSNCQSNTVSVTVAAAALVAVDDTVSGVNGLSGATAVVNAFTGDTVNGVAASSANAILSVAAGSSVPAGLSFDTATGNVDVAAGTAAGDYSFDYTICEKLNPDNCQTATLTVRVAAAALVANADVTLPIRADIGDPSAVNVLENDTLNGGAIDPSDMILRIASGSGVPGIMLDTASGNVSIASDVSAGTYSFSYEVCEALNPTNCATSSVTIMIEPAISTVEGTVYLDRDSDSQLGDNDEPRSGWIVEILRDGALIATTITNSQGEYRFEDMLSAPGYSIVFRNPSNNVVYGRIDDIVLASNTLIIDQNMPIDPSGVIYNSVTRSPVQGALATLLGPNGLALPQACFVDPAQQNQLTDANGEYRFDIIPGGATQCPVSETDYVISVTPPSGFGFVSTVLLPQQGAFDPTGLTDPVRIAPEPGAPIEPAPIYYLTFSLQSGDPNVIYNHIPLDPFTQREPLIVTKTSPKRDVSVGDLVPYTITVRNAESVQRAGVTVIDLLPSGFKYVLGSASINGQPSEPVHTNSGRQIEWRNQTIPANATITYNLVLTVGAGVTTGTKINTGFGLSGLTGDAVTNRATAAVRIVPSSVFDCSELLGKVFEDTNRNGYQDEGEPGVPAVRLVTVNGLLVSTDEYGRYHIPCAAVPDARIGSNFVLKVDPRTLPLGWAPTTDNPRSIRLTRGKMGELNFGVAPIEVSPPVIQKEGE